MTEQSPRRVLNGIEATIAGLRANTHGKVLVAGVIGDNLPEKYRNHPQVICWTGNEVEHKEVPAAVRLILITRFNRHVGYGRMHRIAESRDIPCSAKTLGTGEIKRILMPLVERGPVAEKEEPVSMPEAVPVTMPPAGTLKEALELAGAQLTGALAEAHATIESLTESAETEQESGELGKRKQVRKGALGEFLNRHYDITATPFNVEAERLEKLARKEGLASSLASIKQGMYKLRRELGSKPRRAAAPSTLTRAEIEATAPRSPQRPASAGQLSAQIAKDDATLIEMLEEAERGMSAIAATLALLRETVAQRSKKRAELKALISEL